MKHWNCFLSMRTILRRTVFGLNGLKNRVALTIQIRLAQHNIEAAEKEFAAAKRWAQDSLLAQLTEVLILPNFSNGRLGSLWRRVEIMFKERIISTRSLLSPHHLHRSHYSAKQLRRSNLVDFQKQSQHSSKHLRKILRILISWQMQLSVQRYQGKIPQPTSSNSNDKRRLTF
jgi:hypothetical protein